MASNSHKTVFILAGPTASGKTAIAIELAKRRKTVIISADSRQCYKELSIGVARPSPTQLAEVPHYFIASHSIHESVTAATFENYALEKTSELFQTHDQIVMVGGTGLYIKAFCEGLDIIPLVPPEIRAAITRHYETAGIIWLKEQIREKDPQFYQSGEMQNPQRMLRALEVVEATGKSILAFHSRKKSDRGFRILKTAIDLPKETLHRNINNRVDQMVASGLVEEVRSLLPHRNLNALHTVGYTEIFEYLDGKITLPAAIEKIRTNTRQYAKRQLTWFRKDTDVKWLSPDELANS